MSIVYRIFYETIDTEKIAIYGFAFLKNQYTCFMKIMTKELVNKTIPERQILGHKGTYGHVLVIGGSQWYRGASIFASMAALKIGAGLCTLASLEKVLQSASIICPELLFFPLKENEGCITYKKTLDKKIQQATIVVLGCGIGGAAGIPFFTKSCIKKVVALCKQYSIPLILDADGLNFLASQKNICLPEKTVLTPHPKEMARLMNISAQEVLNNPTETAKLAAKKYRAVVVLKCAKNYITDGENLWITDTGNSALSKGGSGDVLAGIIAGLLSQGEFSLPLVASACFIHGRAGTLASKKETEYSVLARTIIDHIPEVLAEIQT